MESCKGNGYHEGCNRSLPILSEYSLSSSSVLEVVMSHTVRSLCLKGFMLLSRRPALLSDTAFKVKQSYERKLSVFVIFKKTHFSDSNLNSFPSLHQKSNNRFLVISYCFCTVLSVLIKPSGKSRVPAPRWMTPTFLHCTTTSLLLWSLESTTPSCSCHSRQGQPVHRSGQGLVWPFGQQICEQADFLSFVVLHFCATLDLGDLQGFLLLTLFASILLHLHACQFLAMPVYCPLGFSLVSELCLIPQFPSFFGSLF